MPYAATVEPKSSKHNKNVILPSFLSLSAVVLSLLLLFVLLFVLLFLADVLTFMFRSTPSFVL